jgi:hypothetical protein
MIGMFWAAGLPWRMTFARICPHTWAVMHQAARIRHLNFLGNSHDLYCRAFYYGR